MILVDANLLIYAKVASMLHHGRAHAWWNRALAGPGRVGLPWQSLPAFLRLTTNPRVFDRPLTGADAWRQVEQWLAEPNVWIPAPKASHAELLGRLVAQTGSTATQEPNVHLAALAIDRGLELVSTDRGFARFAGLKWRDPLA